MNAMLVAQVPQVISYQGRIVVGTANFDGSGQFKFALVNTNGSVTYWSNDGTSTAGSQPTASVSLTVTKGLYSLLLGDTTIPHMTTIPASVFNNSDVCLRVWFNDGVNGFQLLSPDQRLAAVGYALMANTAQSLASGAALTNLSGGSGALNLSNFTLTLPVGISSLIAGALQTSTLGTGVQTALSTAPNAPGGIGILNGSANSIQLGNGTWVSQIPGNLSERQIAQFTDNNIAGFDGASSATSNGTDTGGNVRCEYLSPAAHPVQDLTLWFSNWQNGDSPGANNITIRAAIEYPVGTFYPVFLNGVRDAVVAPGGVVHFDPCAVDIPANTPYYVRAYVTVASSGMTWPLGFITANSISGYILHGGYIHGTGTSDLTTSGTIADSFGYAFGPMAITGHCGDGANLPAVAIVGDSIAEGPNPVQAFQYHDTYLDRLLFASGFPFMNMAQSGAKITDLQGQRDVINLICRNCTHVISEGGINDLRNGETAAQLEAYYVTYWTEFTSRGLKVYQTTLTPNSTSTDNWATAGNQTGLNTSVRTAINDWIRTTPAPLSGYIEVGSYVETSTDSNIWKTNGTPYYYTQDGLHPSGRGSPAGANGSIQLTTSVILPAMP